MKNQYTGLMRAVLKSANLDRAVMRDADLSRVDLEFTSLRNADLTNASLRGAALGGANLSGASVAGADFDGADLASTRLVAIPRHRDRQGAAHLKAIVARDDAPVRDIGRKHDQAIDNPRLSQSRIDHLKGGRS